MSNIVINYDDSVVKKIGDFGFEVVEIVGRYNDEEFKVTLTSSRFSQNNKAKCVKGELTEGQIVDVLRKFDYMGCKRKEVAI